jgi:hypothetical protein
MVAITTSVVTMGLLLWRLEARHVLVAAESAPLLDDCSKTSRDISRNTTQAARQGEAPLLQDSLLVEKDLGKTRPHVVQRMQARAVDWHMFVKLSRTPIGVATDDDPHFPGTPACSRASALQVGAFFSGFEFEQHMFGPLADYAGCRVLADPCAIHSLQATCVMDAFCGWCEGSSVCLSRANEQQHCNDSQFYAWDTTGYRAAYTSMGHPGVPFKIASGGTLQDAYNITQCKQIVPGVFLEPHFLENTMLHHWHADAWPGIVKQWWDAVDTAQKLGSETSPTSNEPIQGYATVLNRGRDISPNIRFLYTNRHIYIYHIYIYHIYIIYHEM